jgi:hypothetical protein
VPKATKPKKAGTAYTPSPPQEGGGPQKRKYLRRIFRCSGFEADVPVTGPGWVRSLI